MQKNFFKKSIAVIFAVAFFVFLPNFARAEDSVLADPGITPSNPFYFLDQFGEWFRTNVLTFDKDERGAKNLDYADERVAELQKLAETGKLKEKYAEKISVRYQQLIEKYEQRIREKIAAGEDTADLEEQLSSILANHVDILESLTDEVNDDAAEEYVNEVLDAAEEEDDTIHEREFENEDDSDFTQEIQEKITKAETEIAQAQQLIAQKQSAGEDVAADRTRLEKATDFLTQAKEALEDQQYDVAYALARQSTQIARLIQRPAKGEKIFIDDISEKATEEILQAEEKIAKVKILLEQSTASETEKSTAAALMNEASNFVNQARSALEMNDFITSQLLGKEARKLAASALEIIDNEDDDENEDESKDEGDRDQDYIQASAQRIEDAQKKITEAEQKLQELTKEGKDSSVGKALLDQAKSQLAQARTTYAAGDYFMAYIFARQAKSLANEAKEGKYAEEDGEQDDEEKKDEDENKDDEGEDENESESEDESDDESADDERGDEDADEEKEDEDLEDEKDEDKTPDEEEDEVEEKVKEDQEKQKEAEEQAKEEQKKQSEKEKEQQKKEEEQKKEAEEKQKEEEKKQEEEKKDEEDEDEDEKDENDKEDEEDKEDGQNDEEEDD